MDDGFYPAPHHIAITVHITNTPRCLQRLRARFGEVENAIVFKAVDRNMPVPDEILHTIFKYLPFNARLPLRRACKHFCNLITTSPGFSQQLSLTRLCRNMELKRWLMTAARPRALTFFTVPAELPPDEITMSMQTTSRELLWSIVHDLYSSKPSCLERCCITMEIVLGGSLEYRYNRNGTRISTKHMPYGPRNVDGQYTVLHHN